MAPRIHLTCLCGAVREPSTLLKSSLPSDTDMCHCDTCRYSSGAIALTFVRLISGPSDKSIQALRPYNVTKEVTRYFCSTCGTHCFGETKLPEGGTRWSACGGIIESPDNPDSGLIDGIRNVVTVTKHEFVQDTKDGGAAYLYRSLNGQEIPSFAGLEDTEVVDPSKMKDAVEQEVVNRSQDEKLHASCRCGGVQFYVTRPFWKDDYKYTSRLAAKDRSKYKGLFCVCRDCRLGPGFSPAAWTYSHPTTIFTLQDQPVIFWDGNPRPATNLGSLQRYQSSPDSLRSFCNTCGATVFYESANGRNEIVNIAPALFRSPTGAMAREWIEWDFSKMAWDKEAMDRDLADALLAQHEN